MESILKVVDFDKAKEEQGRHFSNPFTALIRSRPTSSMVWTEENTDRASGADLEDPQQEDCLGLVRELLDAADKSKLESIHRCHRLEGQEPIGLHNTPLLMFSLRLFSFFPIQ